MPNSPARWTGDALAAVGNARGRPCFAPFLESIEQTQKFEFRQTKSGSELNADFKAEYSEKPVDTNCTDIARLEVGCLRRVLPLVAE